MTRALAQASTIDKNLPILDFLKQNNQDFEWYPTTDEMLNCVTAHANNRFNDRFSENDPMVSVLDCGAGDGRALKRISNGGAMYAIEKSERLIFEMAEEIFIVGTEFHESTLIDKQADCIFCNPPYSQFQEWASKIIREGNCTMVYLVIPKRWADSVPINDALISRKAKVEVLGSYDFLAAERQARAIVDVLAIDLSSGSTRYNSNREPKIDPFSIWFDDFFSISAQKTKSSDYATELSEKNTLSEKLSQQLVDGKNLIQALVKLYNNEMQNLIENYQAVGQLDSAILKELGVNVSGLRGGLKQKINGLKSKYWNEFFNNYERITARLTSESREAMLKKLRAHMSIDFTESNALAITAWAIKNANQYYDTQLITMFESMIDQANIALYKSNLRTWGNEEWRYNCSGRGPDGLSHYALELRIVLHRYAAVGSGYEYPNGLYNEAHTYIEDLLTVAGNLGYTSSSNSKLKTWESNKKQLFWAEDNSELMSVSAFMNGNLHIKFNQLFIRKLNVEFGRLKGWLKNKEQAARELNIPVGEVSGFFNSNHQISLSSIPQICCGTTVQ